MIHEQGRDLNTVYKYLVSRLLRDPEHRPSPRGRLTHEALCSGITLEDPRARLITSPHRSANYRFGVGEFIWYWTGRCDLAFVERYNKRLRDFSDDGYTLRSAYGRRLLGPHGRGPGLVGCDSQWRRAVETLKRDPDSRQAVLLILRQEDLAEPTKDVPCTCSLQFIVRNRRVHLHVHMRSNDVVWGMPYDVFSFTLMQEAMALELGLELGRYHHTAGSLHLYEHHLEMAAAIDSEVPAPSTPMPPLDSLQSLWNLCNAEPYVATGQEVPDLLRVPEGSGEAWMLDQLRKQWRTKETV